MNAKTMSYTSDRFSDLSDFWTKKAKMFDVGTFYRDRYTIAACKTAKIASFLEDRAYEIKNPNI